MLSDYYYYPDRRILATCHEGIYDGAEIQDALVHVMKKGMTEVDVVVADMRRVTNITKKDTDLAKLHITLAKLGKQYLPDVIVIANHETPGFDSRRAIVDDKRVVRLLVVESWDAALSQISDDLNLPDPFER